MADNTPPLRDHYLIQYILGKVVNHACNCELVNRANIDEMENYPFFTFSWIDFINKTTTDWRQQYTCVIQVDVHSSDPDQGLELATRLYSALQEDTYRRWFKQAEIVPVQTTSPSDRTALRGINYDNDAGFDCSFLVNSKTFEENDLTFVYSDVDIESVANTGAIAESDLQVNAKAKKGELNG